MRYHHAGSSPYIRTLHNLLRGLGKVLVDGEPLQRGLSIDNINPNQVARIEILRSASAELSTQAVAGRTYSLI